MKTRPNLFAATLVALAFALAAISGAAPRPDGGPDRLPTNDAASATSETNRAYSTSAPDEQMPVITIHSTGDVSRGKTGSFVLEMKPRLMLGGTWVNFSVSGSAIPGVDYVALVSPTYIGQSGFGTVLVQTLPDPRASAVRRSYSVVITLEPGLGYALGEPKSAQMMIKP